MRNSSLMLSTLFLLQGCASSLGTFYNRPVVEDEIPGFLSTFSLSADRRTVIIPTSGKNAGKFCAEPPPDSATQLKSELQASLEGKAKLEKIKADIEGKGEYKDRLETNIVVLAERTPALDAFRTGVYALCQYKMNGWMTDEQVNQTFLLLIDSFTKAHNFQKAKEETANEAARKGGDVSKSKIDLIVTPPSLQVVGASK